MSGFTKSALEKKLQELNATQQCIQTLSFWIIHHRKHFKNVVQIWYRELKKAKTNQKLPFMYLANDVIQNSKKKGPEFTKEFATVLAKAFYYVAIHSDDKTRKGLYRLLSVWEERSIYNAKQIKEFQTSISNAVKYSGPQSKPKKKESKKKESKKKVVIEPSVLVSLREELELGSPKPPPEPEDFIKHLQDLENAASSDAVIREKIASLPPEVSDASLLSTIEDKEVALKREKQVDDAIKILEDYNDRLTAELENRKKASQMLSDYIRFERKELANSEKEFEEYTEKLERITKVRDELNFHIQNLPDLTRLPDVTGGLAPLPSAGDLFSLGQK